MESTRILIADDQTDVQEALRLLLKNQGFSADTVSSPKAALEAVRTNEYDILLIDMNYGRDTTSGDEGVELLRKIQTLDAGLPVVLMTAWASVDLAVEAMQRGGRDFIQKPWDNDRLLKIIRRHAAEGRAIRERQKQEKAADELLREIEEARGIQRGLMPMELQRIMGCDIQAAWTPAKDVGGDYFDTIPLSDSSIGFCIADVSGKGLPAALLMSNVQASVRALASSAPSCPALCSQLNRTLSNNLCGGKFVTFFYGILDTNARRLRYCNAGHVSPILIRCGDGAVERLGATGLLLGVIGDASYTEIETDFRPGDRLVLYTDGLSEAARPSGEEFGADRLIDVILQHRDLPGIDLKAAIMEAASRFASGELQDDATLLIVTAG